MPSPWSKGGILTEGEAHFILNYHPYFFLAHRTHLTAKQWRSRIELPNFGHQYICRPLE
jgi:hypothetical protein